MWRRKELKRQARAVLRRNYWRAVLVCLILAVFAGASSVGFSDMRDLETALPNYRYASSTDVVSMIVKDYLDPSRVPVIEDIPAPLRATQGVMATLFNNVTKSGSFIFGVLNGLNQLIFHGSVMSGIILFIGAVLGFLYWMFVGNILRVGESRFFLENRNYRQTVVTRIIYLYRIRRLRKVGVAMLMKTLIVAAWSLTIVGGFIMSYSYRMVNHILAENPDVPWREALRLSRRMMKGNKWRVFVLDVTFWPWLLLSGITFGVLDLLFVEPYRTATDAELYMQLREQAVDAKLPGFAFFDDRFLRVDTEAVEEGGYPVERYTIPEYPGRNWISGEPHRRYALPNLVLIFFTFCFVGWAWEVLVDLFNYGAFTNRGSLLGPWLPLYGCGGLIALLVSRKTLDKPVLSFFIIMFTCGVMEYFTGLAFEVFLGVRYWNYDGYFLNLHGRVCLEGLLVFGLAGSMGVYFFAPMLDSLYSGIPKRWKLGLCTVLLVLFASDIAYSALHPNTGARITYSLASESSTKQSATAGCPHAGFAWMG